MNWKNMACGMVAAILWTAPVSSRAQIVTFEFSALLGGETTATNNSKDANLNDCVISRGFSSVAANGGRFNATNWAITSIANAVSGGKYMEFTITPNSGYQFNVSSILVQWQRSSTGNRGVSLRSSADGYASDIGSEWSLGDVTTTQSNTWTFTQGDSTTPVTYRLYAWAEAVTGSGGPGDGVGNDIVVYGAVSAAGGGVPEFTSGTGPYGATSGVAMAYTVTASGSPEPVLALQGTTASGGYGFTAGTGQLDYTPPAADGGATQTFTFTASNSEGVATQTVSVAVTAGTAPSFTSGTSYGATTGVERVFTVTASGTPAPTLALRGEDAAGDCDFTPGTGVLTYTPVAGDVGTRTFTFTASNVVGVATQVVSVMVVDVAVAPTFTSGTSCGATSQVAMAFTVTASGNPTPTLALQSQTASSGYSFTPATGVLDYTPPTNDVGTRNFTFTASNSAGVATQTVSVTVAAALTAIPAVSVANITTNAFTVNWTACTDATNYQVQVATDTNFTVGGSGTPALSEDFATQTDTAVPSGWACSGVSDLDYVSEPYVGAAVPAFKFSGTGQWLTSPTFATGATNLQFFAYGNGGAGSTIAVSALVSGVWTLMDTVIIALNDGTYNVALNPQTTQLKFSFTKVVNCAFDDVVVQGTEGGGSLLVDATLAALTYNATGLTMSTTYYVRARQEGGEWSDIVPATTASPTPVAPSFGANPGPLGATTGVSRVFTVMASGYPAPTLALQGQTASSGYSFVPATGVLTYTAPEADVGVRTFTFTASNATGVATQTVSVTVSLPPETVPVFGANPGPVSTTVEVAKVFTVTATGYPTPTLSLQGTTAASGYNFTAGTGQLSYTPPANDIGTQTFTFAASNNAGVAMQTVSVTVASAPVYIPTVAVTNIGTNSFLVDWSEVTDAVTYQIQIGADTNFTGASGGTNVLSESFATLTDSTPPSGWTSSLSAGLDYTVEPYVGLAPPAFKFGTTGQRLTSPTFATGATNLQFWAYGRNGSGSIITVSGLVSGVWTLIDAVSIAQNEATYNVPLDPQTTQLKFTFTKVVSCGFDDVVVQAASTGSTLVDETVAALSYGATGLDVETAYYVRVRAAPTGTWSSVVQATTLGTDPLAPWFIGGAGPYSTTAGVAVVATVAAMGIPDPVLALQEATASGGSYSFTTDTGYFIYSPPIGDAGAQTFTFTASNSMGVVTQIVEVAVAAPTAPTFTPLGTQYATTLVAKVFFVEVSGAPTPELSLEGTTASSGYTFSPEIGRLSYAAPTNDAGTQTFTFAASNIAGVATQVVSVVVSNAPASAPTIDPIPSQSTMVGLELDYAVTATDPDTSASNMTFSCASAVASATWAFDTNSGYFLFIPTTNQIGTNIFTFTAIDNTALSSAPSNMAVVVSAAGSAVAVSFGQVRIVGEEGGSSVSIPVNLAFSGTAAVQVRFSGPTNGTALRGVDFNCSTTLVISGASSGNLVVDIVNDALAEGPETVKITLVPVAPATAGSITQAVFYIRDDDTASIMAANTTSGSNQEYEGPGNRIFQGLCPDVALVQEFNMTNGTTAAAYRSWVDQNFGTNFQYCVQAGVSIPNGVVSRWPISSWGVWDDTTLSDRDFVWAKIELPGTQKLYVVSLHIKASSTSSDVNQRIAEATALTNYIANAGWGSPYIVIGGDFNLYSTNETALKILTTKVTTDKHQPADQFGDRETNSARDNPYDRVLPSTNLDARHRTFYFGGYTYANGIVFDSRIVWASGLPPPVLAADSAAVNMQHMGVMKVFELEKDAAVDDPLAFSATAVGPDQIDLAFTPNSLGDDVIVVWDNDGTFTAPTGTAPSVGASFAGGTVLYKGVASPQSHTGLTSCSPYYYQCWSYAGIVYSTNGLPASATTEEPAAPASIWASATNNEAFTAAWSAVAGITTYQLDVCPAPSFSGAGGGWGPIFRETMGTPTAGTTTLAEHEAVDGFDNDGYTMWSGGADNAADVRTSIGSAGYADPAGNAASGGANVYFPTNGLTGTAGFAIEGIDARSYEALSLSFAYNKESATTNMALSVDWSTDGGTSWNPVTISNFPADNAATNWYMVSNLTVSASALGTTDLSLRWMRADGSVPGRIDDVLLQGYAATAEFVSGYSNRIVSGTTSQVVTGLTGDVTYYFRVAAVGGCAGAYSPTASATPSGTLAAPTFGANPGPLGATTGVARAFTVTASGYPAPTLTLTGQTASSGYVFVPATGVLTYTPPEVDVGSRTFTFRAANSQGAATQTVTVAVAAGIPSAPASIWASATNVVGFTAAWTPVTIATGYRLDVSTEADFQVSGGESIQTVLASNAATDVSLITGDWSGTDLSGTNGYVVMTQSTSVVVSPAFSTVGYTNLTVDFAARTYGGSTCSNITVSISTNNGANWSVVAVVSPSNGSAWVVMPTLSAAANLGHVQTRIRWQSLDANGTAGVGVRYLAASGWSPGFTPSFVAGYSNLAVAGTSQAVAGLSPESTYYFRVRAETAVGAGVDSATANVTTLAKSGQTIDFPAIGAQIATNVLSLSATASSGLTVGFAVGSGPATISNGTTLAFSGAGTVSIVASQAGDASWNPAPSVTNTFTVAKATAGVTLGGLSQTFDGTPKTATAITVPAGLTVEFTYDGSVTVPSAEGSYAVTGTVNDAIYSGSAAGMLVISAESLTDFQLWVRDDQGLSLSDPNYTTNADYDNDGMTTWEEYLADTDPSTNASVLALTGQYSIVSASNAAGKIRVSFPASTSRYYQLVYSTNILSPAIVSNLGWGVSGMAVTNNSSGTWYGAIRALLAAP